MLQEECARNMFLVSNTQFLKQDVKPMSETWPNFGNGISTAASGETNPSVSRMPSLVLQLDVLEVHADAPACLPQGYGLLPRP